VTEQPTWSYLLTWQNVTASRRGRARKAPYQREGDARAKVRTLAESGRAWDIHLWRLVGQDVTADAIQGANDLSDAAKRLQDYVDQPGLYRHLSIATAVQSMQHQRFGGAVEALNRYVGHWLEERAQRKKARTAAKAKATRSKNAAARAKAKG
jgi:hypothetical protein